ncbi:hypothetical protein OXYTRIMIC_207 [Oxytricha trifallax]|uniref:Uncharacterized protein n=1 Tax=Oxytricha trifallax TaxID=1172189 RepID=A0A073I088_9SPIT|nr:hypothetical protein OXYTRIMIC_207 [Oxytricha trifallax]
MEPSSDQIQGPQQQIQQQAPLGKVEADRVRDILEVKVIRNAIHAKVMYENDPREKAVWKENSKLMYASDRTRVESFVSEKMPGLHYHPYWNIYVGARSYRERDEGTSSSDGDDSDSSSQDSQKVSVNGNSDELAGHQQEEECKGQTEDASMSEEDSEQPKQSQILQQYDQETRMLLDSLKNFQIDNLIAQDLNIYIKVFYLLLINLTFTKFAQILLLGFYQIYLNLIIFFYIL